MRARLSTFGRRREQAFTLIEAMIAVAIVAILATVVYPSYAAYIFRAKVNRAVSDIREMEMALDRYYIATNGGQPPTLAGIGYEARLDPWGRTYQYLPYADLVRAGKKHPKGARMDKKLKPINSDYDLYSLGEDGMSAPPLNAKPSLDDVVRAGDGAFVGLADDF